MSQFFTLKVKQIERLTPNSVAISLEIPGEVKDEFKFKAGQYITIRYHLDGEEVRRAYSISSSTEDEDMTIGVKKVEGGKFSVFANTALKEGDSLEVMPPEGRFTYESDSQADHIAAFAAGSGITPIMSIVQSVLDSNENSTMVLVYGNQNKKETMFHDTINELLDKYTDRFFVQYIYSRSREENSLFGRIESSTVNFILKNKFKDRKFSAFYLCGPEPMINTVKDALEKNEVDQEAIYTASHTLKGAASNLGASRVEIVARQLMELADEGRLQECNPALTELQLHFAELIEHLQEFLGEYESEESCAF